MPLDFWRTVTRFESEKIVPVVALRNTLGVVLALIAGVAAGSLSTGLIGSIGALNVSFSDRQDPYVQRARRMLAASVLVGLAVLAGGLAGRNPTAAVLVTAVSGFAAGMMVALGTTAADIGLVTLVTMIVFAGQPMNAGKAAPAALAALAGGILQTSFALALWPVRRHEPERRVLADLYLDLARLAPSPATTAPAAGTRMTEAQKSLATLSARTVAGERYLLLLSQAEGIRLGLLALGRLRIRLARDPRASACTSILDRAFELSSTLLRAISNILRARDAAGVNSIPEEFQILADTLRDRHAAECSPESTGMVREARFQLDALAGRFRAAADLAAHSTERGSAEFERHETRQPAKLRLGSMLATLRANLSLQSASCRHAIRLAGCLAVGHGLGMILHGRRSYWVPMTIALVLKPDFGATFSRGVLRLGGTFVGLVFTTALFHRFHPDLVTQMALVAAATFVLRCLGPANYGILTAAVSALVVLLIAATGVPPREVIAARGLNTALGGAIALLGYLVWPTWERTRVPEALALMLDAYREYFHVVREAYLTSGTPLNAELDRTRLAARLARSNAEASVDRVRSEPGRSQQEAHLLAAMLASSHRFVHAAMALEAGLARGLPAPAREPFQTLTHHVELTLHSLAAALRGSPVSHEELPDLREDHRALVHSGDSGVERHTLVNVEADRIVNSVNTLAEQVLRFSAPGQSPRRQHGLQPAHPPEG